jgi:hypothetical protein
VANDQRREILEARPQGSQKALSTNVLNKVNKPRRKAKIKLGTGGKGKLTTPMNQPLAKHATTKQ